MVIRAIWAACCLLSAGSMFCTWLGNRMGSAGWISRAGLLLTVQIFVMAAGLLAAIFALARDICRKRGWKACLGEAAWRAVCMAVIAVIFMAALVYHIAATGGV